MDMIREELATLDDITPWAPPGSCASLHMLRLDKIHPIVSGNKWYKLKHNIADAKQAGKTGVLTFGGGYSNHLVATAAAALGEGLSAIGIVRGVYEKPTPTLTQCAQWGMDLRFLTKADYHAAQNNPDFEQESPHSFIIPEGGANEAGIRGAEEIAALIPADASVVCVSVGSGTTLAGLHRALPPAMMLDGFCAARSCNEAQRHIDATRDRFKNRAILHNSDYAFAKATPGLPDFMRRFYADTGIPLDVVYTGKMMQRVCQISGEGFYKGHRIVCIHTGGLQGNPPSLFP